MLKAAFYSNCSKKLLDKLKQNLFIGFPGENHYIFISNKHMKNWLMKKFCDDASLQVSFDLKFVNFSNFLNFIQNSLDFSKEKKILNYLELNLIIREKLTLYLFENSFLDSSIKNYLLKNNLILEKRLSKICDELTKSFLDYSIYGSCRDLSKKRELFWQAALFYEIFYIDKHFLPYRDLKDLNAAVLKNSFFHFFSINFIPRAYFDFMDTFSNVFHYINSPCRFFWEDIVSDYERYLLKKRGMQKKEPIQKIEELDFYLRERNKFLANMERVRKKYLSIIGQYDVYHPFEYFSERQDDTFLSLFQNDILNLENRNGDNLKKVIKQDSSFQIHVCVNKFREVQVLHSNILNILSKDKSLNLSDIHVIAPDINEYAPYIHMIFNDDENSLCYKMADLSIDKASKLIAGTDKLFSLAGGKWDKTDVLELFENDLFQKKSGISNDELVLLFELIEKANISFGLNESHVSRFLENNSYTEHFVKKCFDKGLSRLIMGMIFYLNEDFLGKDFSYDLPADQLDFSNCGIVMDKFLKIIFKLEEDLKIIEENRFLPLREWRIFFKKIIDGYFFLEDSFIEKSALDICVNFFLDLKKIESGFDGVYLFETIYNYFKKHVGRGRTYYNLNNEQAIFFSSFDQASIPANAVFIIGLGSNSLELKNKDPLDINDLAQVPCEHDFVRSFFLQSVLNAKDYLILSYPSSDNNKSGACGILQEMLFYLDTSYSILDLKPSVCLLKKHEGCSFDKEYFSENNNNFSKANFLAAKSFYLKKNAGSKDASRGNSKTISDVIDTNGMRMLCKNPIKFYVNKGLEIYLEDDKKSSDFNFSYLDKYIINQAFFKHDINDVLFNYEKKAKVPAGVFFEIEKEKLTREHSIFQETLTALDLDKSEFLTVEFNLNTDRPKQIEKNKICLPAIEIKAKDKTIKIIGKLENVTKKGLFLPHDANAAGIIRNWSDILLFSNLGDFFSKKIFFSKSLQIKTFNFTDINNHLSEFLDYYSLCLNEPSFMIKQLIEHILLNDEKALDKAINNMYEETKLPLDIYTKWFFANYKKPKANEILNKWTNILRNVFNLVLEEF